jgi:ABC-type uncharacterized transport system permease subunit
LTALRTIAVLSWRDYRVAYPLQILLGSSLPRAVLQVVFVAYVGQFAGGAGGRDFALVGASMQVITIATVVKGGDMLVEDRQFGTLYRLRLSTIALPVVALVKWWVFVAEGTLGGLVAVTAAGVLFGRTGLLVGFWGAAGLVLLVALSTSALGMATAAAAMTQRAEVFLVNLVSYLLLVVTGAVAPLDRLPEVVATLARWLPITNGLLGLRHALAGRSWWSDAAAEAAVGACWLGVAALLLTLQDRRARAKDSDDRW